MKHLTARLAALALLACLQLDAQAFDFWFSDTSETCKPGTECTRKPNIPPDHPLYWLIAPKKRPVPPPPPPGPPSVELLPPGATTWSFVEGRPGNPGMWVPQWPAQPGGCVPPPGMKTYPCPATPIEREIIQPAPLPCKPGEETCIVRAVPEPGTLALVCAALAGWAIKRRRA